MELPASGAQDRALAPQGRGGAGVRSSAGLAAQKRLCARYLHLRAPARPRTRSPSRGARAGGGSSGRSPARWPAARMPAGRASERRAPASARATSNMRHSGRGRPVRRTLEAPMRGGSAYPPTRDSRPRQLRDEVKSGGNQPTHIRVIHRRSNAARDLNLRHGRSEPACGVRGRVLRTGPRPAGHGGSPWTMPRRCPCPHSRPPRPN